MPARRCRCCRSLPVVVLGLVLTGGGVPLIVIAFVTLAQRLTPPGLQGRVYAAADTAVTALQALLVAVGAALIGVVGYRVLLGAIAVAMTLAGLLLWRPARATAAADAPVPGQP